LPKDFLNPCDEETGTSSEPHACKQRATMLLAKHEGSDIKRDLTTVLIISVFVINIEKL